MLSTFFVFDFPKFDFIVSQCGSPLSLLYSEFVVLLVLYFHVFLKCGNFSATIVSSDKLSAPASLCCSFRIPIMYILIHLCHPLSPQALFTFFILFPFWLLDLIISSHLSLSLLIHSSTCSKLLFKPSNEFLNFVTVFFSSRICLLFFIISVSCNFHCVYILFSLFPLLLCVLLSY